MRGAVEDRCDDLLNFRHPIFLLLRYQHIAEEEWGFHWFYRGGVSGFRKLFDGTLDAHTANATTCQRILQSFLFQQWNAFAPGERVPS